MSYLVRGRFVLSDRVIKDGAVAVDNGEIVDVGDASTLTGKYARYEALGGPDTIVMPGLINTHTHAAMTLLRGYAEDLPLMEWLEKKVWPLEAELRPRDIHTGALLAAAEALLSGTTTLNSQYFYSEEGNEAEAFYQAGIRGMVGHAFFERAADEAARLTARLAARWHGADNGRIRVSVSPHTPYTVGPKTLVECRRLADELNEKYREKGRIPLCTHLAESRDEARLTSERFGVDTGEGVARYLESLGVLGKDVVAAHCVHLTPADIEALKRNRVSVASNPVSNLKLGNGVAPIAEMLDASVNVSLGTDGSASNNSLDMFETMKVASLLPKGLSGDVTRIPTQTAFNMATANGAETLGWKGVGRIRKGFRADLVLLDVRRPSATPLFDPYNHLVFSAKCGDVQSVLVDGRLVVDQGALTTLDLEELLRRAEKAKDALLARAGA